MKEILGGNLKQFFDAIDKNQTDADITYTGDRYEVWKVSDKLFDKMCDITEEEFVELAGEDAWWRSSEGSVLGIPRETVYVNGQKLKCWYNEDSCFSFYRGIGKYKRKYKSLSDYLCNCVGASQPRNVCACAMDLAKYNGMSMGKLFEIYEG